MVTIPLCTGFEKIQKGGFLAGFLNHQQYETAPDALRTWELQPFDKAPASK